MAAGEREERILRAGEYVLGTLDIEARTAFETELRDSAEARQFVAYWEQRLGALGLALAPEPPPEAVWQRIAAEIDASAANDAPTTDDRTAARGAGVGLWRGLAIAASVAAIALAATLLLRVEPAGPPSPSEAAPAYASMVHDDATGMSWLVTAEAHSHALSVLAMGDYDVPEGKILRLWFKPDDSDPILVGRWPHASGRHRVNVPDRVARVLDRPAQLIVSMEDRSRAGLPTPGGQVMWISPVRRRSG